MKALVCRIEAGKSVPGSEFVSREYSRRQDIYKWILKGQPAGRYLIKVYSNWITKKGFKFEFYLEKV